jgi:hypothetical protein
MRLGCYKYKRKRVNAIFVYTYCVCFLSLSFCSYAWPWERPKYTNIHAHLRDNALFLRAGSSDKATGIHTVLAESESETFPQSLSQSPQPQPFQFSFTTRKVKQREASDFIQDLISRSGIDGNDESQDLRNLITSRTEEYLRDLYDESIDKLPDPRKLLHFLAPKIPAIRHSPDVALRIQSARSDMDCGVAASLIGILAHVCEVYDSVAAARASWDDDNNNKKSQRHGSSVSSAVEMIKDRRFEQLVECVLCGVDVKKRRKEHLQHQLDGDATLEDIEEVLDEEHAKIDEGLCIRDACRAAWGFAVLGVNPQGSIGGEDVMDILVALSLRSRELLLARLQLLRQDDLFAESDGGELAMLTVDERLEELSEEVAEDAASAMWAFACVRACTGLTIVPLLEVCSSILCQDPLALRRRAQDAETTLEATTLGSNDAVDRLAKSEADMSSELEADRIVESSANITATKEHDSHSSNIESQSSLVEKDALIDWLSPIEVTDVLWAVALHGGRSKVDAASREEVALSETVSVLREIAFDRLREWLKDELNALEFRETEEVIPPDQFEEDTLAVDVVDAADLLASENAASAQFEDTLTVGVVDAAALLASENAASAQFKEETLAVEIVDAAALLASKNVDVVDAAVLLASENAASAQFEEDTLAVEMVNAAALLASEKAASAQFEEDTLAVEMVNAAALLASEKAASAQFEEDTLTVEVVDAAALLASEKAANAQFEEDTLTVEVVDAAALLASENVDVVDAAALLASENAASAHGFPPVVTNINVENVAEVGGVQQIPVVSADSLLSAERDVGHGDPDALASSPIAVTDEIKCSGDGQFSELASSSTLEVAFEGVPTPSSFPASGLRLFSPHDLCSLAWVVTELQDALRHSVVDLISKIFLRLGMSGLDNLNGSDLSNLAWAMSRHVREDVISASVGPDHPAVIVMEWVSQKSLMGVSDRFNNLSSAADHILQRFQPPELSRLLWAVGSTHSSAGENNSTDVAGKLAVVGLLAAASDMAVFGTEDLARIMWAFLEVSDLEQVLSQPLVANALGRVLSTVETSLLQWEHGSGCHAESTDSVVKESTRFPSFFGLSLLQLPFLDHKDDERVDVEEFQNHSLVEKKRLPLLRDLPIDPSTLCKAACSLSRLATSYATIEGSEPLLRIAVRLLTSRNGRLLQVCPRQDVIRLCEAVATNESAYGREQIVRQVVRLLNDSDEGSASGLSSYPPKDIATLLWSLGKLGVKHQPGGNDVASAHRRLHFVQELPFLSEEQVRSLSSVCVTRLVR